MRILYYFGCIRDKGHYLWDSDSSQYYADQMAAKVPGLNARVLKCMDGTFPPGGINEDEGFYQESIVPPVRIIAWWDRSVDKRHASNSAFIGYGYESAEAILDDAMIKFPSVMKRQPRPQPQPMTPLSDEGARR